MRLVAPTAFKGTMSPLEAARFLASPGDRLLPLSDGGDGFLECLQHALGGAFRDCPAADPFGRIRPVPVLELPDGTLAVECARVIGLAGLDAASGPSPDTAWGPKGGPRNLREQAVPPFRRDLLDPLRASSLGLGQLLSDLRSARGLWIGLGGSATVDGGMGWPEFQLPPTRVFCDVLTDLGDAARIFGPQKGARAEDIPWLTERLLSQGLPRGPRTGAAGGLGAKLMSLGAELVDGAQTLLDALDFEARCQDCEAVLTGEGRLDASTLEGKLPAAVARRARALGLPVIGRFGCRGTGWEEASSLFDEVSFLV